jgi:hypothetical protein
MSAPTLMLVVIGSDAAPPAGISAGTDGPAPVRGDPYGARVVPQGGTPPYTYTLTDGALPDGTALDTSTGEITGTPTDQGWFEFEIEVADDLGDAEAFVFGITVGGGIGLMTSLPDAVHGVDYAALCKATGGVPPYTWSVEAGGLPSWASLVGDSITGTADNASNFLTAGAVTLRATDTNGNYGEAELFLRTWPPPFVSTLYSTVPTTTFVNANYLGTAVGRHGVSDIGIGAGGTGDGPAIRYSLAGEPPGIVIDERTGALSGIPTTPGLYDMDINTVDALGGNGTSTFQIRVYDDGQMKKYSAYVGNALDSDITVTHDFGTPPYAITVYDTFTGLEVIDVPIGGMDGNSFVLSFKDPPDVGQILVQVLG